MKKISTTMLLCLLFCVVCFYTPTNVYATEPTEVVSETTSNVEETSTIEEDDPLKEILENDPLSDENVEKGKNIFEKVVDAIIPFIKSFLLALFDFFVAIGRAIIEGIKSL